MSNNSDEVKKTKNQAIKHCFGTCCVCNKILNTADIFICEKKEIKDKVCSEHIIGKDFTNRASYVMKKTMQWIFPYFIWYEVIYSCFLILQNKISHPILVFNYLIAGADNLSIPGIMADIIFLLLGIIGLVTCAVSFVSNGLASDIRAFGFKKLNEYYYNAVSYSIGDSGNIYANESKEYHYDFGGRFLNIFLFLIYFVLASIISLLGIVFYVISLVSFFVTHPSWVYKILDKTEKETIKEGEYITNIQDKEAKEIAAKINKEYYYLSNKQRAEKCKEALKDRYFYIKVDNKIYPIISTLSETTRVGSTYFLEMYLVLERVDGIVSAKAYFSNYNPLGKTNKMKLIEACFNKDDFLQWGNQLIDSEFKKTNLTSEILAEIYDKRMSYIIKS